MVREPLNFRAVTEGKPWTLSAKRAERSHQPGATGVFGLTVAPRYILCPLSEAAQGAVQRPHSAPNTRVPTFHPSLVTRQRRRHTGGMKKFKLEQDLQSICLTAGRDSVDGLEADQRLACECSFYSILRTVVTVTVSLPHTLFHLRLLITHLTHTHAACDGTYLRRSCGKQLMDGVDVAHVVLAGGEAS